MISVRCKSCEKKFAVKEKYAGKKGKCPKCSAAIVIPKAEANTTAPESAMDQSGDLGLTGLLKLEAKANAPLQSIDPGDMERKAAK